MHRSNCVFCVGVLFVLAAPDSVFGQVAYRTVNGVNPDKDVGQAVASIGDVDGDGRIDFVVGAPGSNANSLSSNGVTRVYSGADGSILVAVAGQLSNDRLGESVAGGGDVDADGFPDLVAASFVGQNAGSQRGTLRVVSGRTGVVLFTAYGDSPSDWLGYRVATGGDLDNDGFSDVAAGAPLDDNTGSNTGSVRVYQGPFGSPLYTVNGIHQNGGFGRGLAILGDATGDGADDLLIGKSDGNGFARLCSGPTGATVFTVNGTNNEALGVALAPVGDVNGDSKPDFIAGALGGVTKVLSGENGAVLKSLTVASPGSQFGGAVSGAGDFDGDEITDYVIGAFFSDLGGDNSGAAYVFSGATSSVIQTFVGSAFSELGWSVAGLGDMNGDGRGDIAIGAPGYQGAFPQFGLSGRARVFVGLPTACANLSNSVDLNVDGVPDSCQTCQSNIAAGGPGNMKQHICGEPLTFAGNTAVLGISEGTPNGLCVLLASTFHSPNSAFGGTLWPIPVQFMLTLTLDAEGNYRLPLVGGASGPFHIYLQSIAPWVGGPQLYEISPATHLVIGL